MITGNIDILDASLGTRAPFTPNSTLRFGDGILDPGLFVSLRVHCGEGVVPPVSFRYMDSSGRTAADMWLVDARGAQVAALHLDAEAPGRHYEARPLRDADGILRGHAAYRPELVGRVLSAVAGKPGRIYLDDGAFELLPECLEAAVGGYVQSVSVEGSVTTGDVTIACCPCVRLSLEGGAAKVGVIRVPSVGADNGYMWLKVDNVRHVNGTEVDGLDGRLWIGGCHLVIRHGVASNLRVTWADDGIAFAGVLDG